MLPRVRFGCRPDDAADDDEATGSRCEVCGNPIPCHADWVVEEELTVGVMRGI